MMKLKRVPNENTHDTFLTLIFAIGIIITIYSLTPENHCSVYFSN